METISALSAAESTSSTRHWNARLNLVFSELDGRTRLAHSEHEGPLRVQRLFYPESGGKAHCYLLHPPGGVVMGDTLAISARLRRGQALLTTPSAGRFYSVAGQQHRQLQIVDLSVDEGTLEWLPQETILFDGADAQLHNRIKLGASAHLAFWDVLVLGRPASGERFTSGGLEQRLTITRAGRTLFHEGLAMRAGDRVHCSPMGIDNASTLGVAVFTADLEREVLESWRESAEAHDETGAYVVTQRGELLVARYRGENAQRCRNAFADLWQLLGKTQHGASPQIPRIWHT